MYKLKTSTTYNIKIIFFFFLRWNENIRELFHSVMGVPAIYSNLEGLHIWSEIFTDHINRNETSGPDEILRGQDEILRGSGRVIWEL